MTDIFKHYLMGQHIYTLTMLPVCKKHSISLTELAVILFLANNPELDTARDIVKCRNIAKSHVSATVHALEERGLLTAAHRNGNRRSIHLKLTALTDPIVLDGRNAQTQFGEILFAGITEAEKRSLNGVLQKITQNMEAYADGGGKNK